MACHQHHSVAGLQDACPKAGLLDIPGDPIAPLRVVLEPFHHHHQCVDDGIARNDDVSRLDVLLQKVVPVQRRRGKVVFCQPRGQLPMGTALFFL
jgi:hypothetical protein